MLILRLLLPRSKFGCDKNEKGKRGSKIDNYIVRSYQSIVIFLELRVQKEEGGGGGWEEYPIKLMIRFDR